MAYNVKGEKGIPIKKDGNYVMGFDIPEVKIEQLDDTSKTFLAIASTEDEDRDKDIIRVSGWDLKNFKKNPVVPWGHNYYEPPIGKAVMIKKDLQKKRLVFKPQFDSDDPEAMKIFNKYKNGFLKTFSVGFIGVDWSFRDEDDRWYGGREFSKTELLEISAVTVPANPNASVDGIKGVFGQDVKSVLDCGYFPEMTQGKGLLWLPVQDLACFCGPEEKQISEGITAVYAKSFNDDVKDSLIVGYKFNTEMYTEDKAKEFISDVLEDTKTSIYYNIGKDIGSLELVKEQDMDKEEAEIKEEKEEVVEEIEMVEEEKDTDIEVDEEIKEEEIKEEEIKEENKVDSEAKTIDKEVVELLVEEIKGFRNEVCELKKLLAKELEIKENIGVEEKENTEQKNQTEDDSIEIDSSLFSPVEEEKDNETIEFDASLEDVKEAMKNALENNVKNLFQEEMKKVSGKI